MKLQNNEITIRCTELAQASKCLRSLILKIKAVNEGSLEEVQSPEAELGTAIHKDIHNSITGKPTSGINELLFKECVNPGNKKVYLSDKPMGVCKIDPLDKYIYRIYTDEELALPVRPVTIYDIIDKSMFGKELTKFEMPVDYNIIFNGYTFHLTGTLDAASEDNELIVDWKTSTGTPSGSRLYQYYIQMGIYRNLLNKDSKKKTYGILGFIVKNKTPKFVPKGFLMNEDFLHNIDAFIFHCVYAVYEYFITGKIPLYSMNELCEYCQVKHLCTDRPIPQETSIDTMFIDW